jgi:hypothetical protein
LAGDVRAAGAVVMFLHKAADVIGGIRADTANPADSIGGFV